MTFQVLGSDTITWAAGSDPASQNITVPANTNLVLVFWCYYDNAPQESATFTLESNSPDHTFSTNNGSSRGCGVVAFQNPTTGSAIALDVSWNDSPVEGPTTTCVYIEDADLTSFSWRDADGAATTGTTANSVTLTTVSGDIVIKHDVNDTDLGNPALTSGWTSLDTGSNNFEGYRTSHNTASGSTTACDSETESYSAIVAVSIADGSSSASPISATISLAMSASGDLDGAGALSGTVPMAMSLASNLQGIAPVDSSIPLAMSLSSDLDGGGALAGIVTLAMSLASTLDGSGALAGTVPLTLSTAAALDGAGELAGTVALAISAQGALDGLTDGAISATIALAMTTAGALDGIGELAGSGTISITPSGTLAGQGELTGTVALAFDTTAALEGKGELVGSGTLTLTTSAQPSAQAAIAASIPITLTISGDPVVDIVIGILSILAVKDAQQEFNIVDNGVVFSITDPDQTSEIN